MCSLVHRQMPLIACTNQEDAFAIMSTLLKSHHIDFDFIEKGIEVFACPVVFTLEVDETQLSTPTTLTSSNLIGYTDTSTVPLNFYSRSLPDEKRQCSLETALRFEKEDVEMRFKQITRDTPIYSVKLNDGVSIICVNYLSPSLPVEYIMVNLEKSAQGENAKLLPTNTVSITKRTWTSLPYEEFCNPYCTPIILAIYSNDRDSLEMLLKSGKKPNYQYTFRGGDRLKVEPATIELLQKYDALPEGASLSTIKFILYAMGNKNFEFDIEKLHEETDINWNGHKMC